MSIWIPCQMCGWQWLSLICRLSLNCNDFLWCEEAFQFLMSPWSILVIISWAARLCFWKSLLMPTLWRCLRPSWGCCETPSLPEERGSMCLLYLLHFILPWDLLMLGGRGFHSSQVLCHSLWNHVLLCLVRSTLSSLDYYSCYRALIGHGPSENATQFPFSAGGTSAWISTGTQSSSAAGWLVGKGTQGTWAVHKLPLLCKRPSLLGSFLFSSQSCTSSENFVIRWYLVTNAPVFPLLRARKPRYIKRWTSDAHVCTLRPRTPRRER